MYKLEGKVALVTGAAGKRGIGRAIALRLAQEGADVVISDISHSSIRFSEDDLMEGWQGLNDVAKEINTLGRHTAAIVADISSSQEVEQMVASCIGMFDKIDILVNNAAIIGPLRVPSLEVPEEDWNRVLAINVTGTYICTRAVAKRMIERGQGGKIINIASVAGKAGQAGFGPYSVSKFGVLGLTQVLALELARYKIYVNAVCPAFTATEISMGTSIRSDIRKGMSLEEATAKAYADVVPRIPLGRAGQPEDVAKVVAFLASSESDYMTGQAINVTGGFRMKD